MHEGPSFLLRLSDHLKGQLLLQRHCYKVAQLKAPLISLSICERQVKVQVPFKNAGIEHIQGYWGAAAPCCMRSQRLHKNTRGICKEGRQEEGVHIKDLQHLQYLTATLLLV